MFLYPALLIGFAFIAVPLLVHLINLLRHRRTAWAAMDFLLASYRRQRKWIVLRQLLLLLSRLAVAALLIAVLVGWVGGKRLVSALGGQTTHHIVLIDDSYSMQQTVSRVASPAIDDASTRVGSTAYQKALAALDALTRRLARETGDHQLTVMRASRAAFVDQERDAEVQNNSKVAIADVAADISAQSVTSQDRGIERLMSTRASSVRCDLVPALDLAANLLDATTADAQSLYILSDFTRRDWASTSRLQPSLQRFDDAGAKIRLINCVSSSSTSPANLAITDLSPSPDVWVAGVPVMMQVTVQNHSQRDVTNVMLSASVIRYGDEVATIDPASISSGDVQPLPAIPLELIPAGEQLTKSFQVFVDRPGTHIIRVALPPDALAIDNVRVSTLPLADAQKVLIVDGNTDPMGGYLVSTVLDPGSQVRIGTIPEIKPVAALRDLTTTQLKSYRAIYLIDIPEINETTASRLREFVDDGGGLAWFLGDDVIASSYNAQFTTNESTSLLPFPIERVTPRRRDRDDRNASIAMGPHADLLGPIARGGDSVFSLVRVNKSWQPDRAPDDPVSSGRSETKVILKLDQDRPLATLHSVGRGRIVTVMTGLEPDWTNWPGDPTFVVFLLQTNAMLFGGAAPDTSRPVDQPLRLPVPTDSFLPSTTILPPTTEPPRLAIELEAERGQSEIAITPASIMFSQQSGLTELLQPGVIEWQRTSTDGRVAVIPVASVLGGGESDLGKMAAGEVTRMLEPIKVEFVSAIDWADDQSLPGMSTFLLVLLGLLALMLAIEQTLAAWASYHPKTSTSHLARTEQIASQAVQ
ncbi:MAG: BatA domain-containing protein [Planctomycetota bacterium]